MNRKALFSLIGIFLVVSLLGFAVAQSNSDVRDSVESAMRELRDNGPFDENFDLFEDGKISNADLAALRVITDITNDEDFLNKFNKIMTGVRNRVNLISGDSDFLADLDIDSSGKILESDYDSIRKAIGEGRDFIPLHDRFLSSVENAIIYLRDNGPFDENFDLFEDGDIDNADLAALRVIYVVSDETHKERSVKIMKGVENRICSKPGSDEYIEGLDVDGDGVIEEEDYDLIGDALNEGRRNKVSFVDLDVDCDSTAPYNGGIRDYKVAYCNPSSIAYISGEFTCNSDYVEDATEDVARFDGVGRALVEAAPSIILVANFEERSDKVFVIFQYPSGYNSGETCLGVKGDYNDDGIYEEQVYDKCFTGFIPGDNKLVSFEADTTKSLLFYTAKIGAGVPLTSVKVDYIGFEDVFESRESEIKITPDVLQEGDFAEVEVIIPNFRNCTYYMTNPEGVERNMGGGGCGPSGVSSGFSTRRIEELFGSLEKGKYNLRVVAEKGRENPIELSEGFKVTLPEPSFISECTIKEGFGVCEHLDKRYEVKHIGCFSEVTLSFTYDGKAEVFTRLEQSKSSFFLEDGVEVNLKSSPCTVFLATLLFKSKYDSACGNDICEAGEDILTCPEDCKESGDLPEIDEDDRVDGLECSIGCLYKDSCVNIGVRVGDNYCDFSEDYSLQKAGGEYCDNSFECSSNICADSVCVEKGIFQKFLAWFKRLFG